MKNRILTDLIIDSKEHCFFCLDKIPLQLLNESTSNFSAVHSLQYLSRFLGTEVEKIFVEKDDIPPQLMAKVEMSRLKAHLCPGCASANETFSKLCRRLEKIKMEVMSSLQQIYRKLLEAEKGASGTIAVKKLADYADEKEYERDAKGGIMDVLRKDTIQKCSVKLRDVKPKVKIQNLTNEHIRQEKQKFVSSFRKSARRKSSLISHNLSDSDPFQNYRPVIVSEAVDGVKTELDESISIDPCSDSQEFDDETGSYQSSDNLQTPISKVKRESRQFAVVRRDKQQRHNQRRSDPRIKKINENIIQNRIKSEDKRSSMKKFSCRLCGNGFSDRRNIARHIKSVHLQERRFRCEVCSNAFSLKQHLENHMQSHTGIRPFQCHLCSKQCFRMEELRRHLLVHSGTRHHKCKPCDRAFYTRKELKSHERIVHRNV